MSDRETAVLLVTVSALYLGLTLGRRAAVGDWYGGDPPLVGAVGLAGGLLFYALSRRAENRGPGSRWAEVVTRLVGLGCLLAAGYWFRPLVGSPPELAGLGVVSAVAFLGGGAVLVALVGAGLTAGRRVRDNAWFVRGLIGVTAATFAGLFGVLLVATGLY